MEPEALALACLAYLEMGMVSEAQLVADRLARATEPLSGETATPTGRSVFGNAGSSAIADVTALCALAFERSGTRSVSRPSRSWLLRRLSSFRGPGGLFGGASTNGVCGLATLMLMRDQSAGDPRVVVEGGGAQREVEVPLDRWLSVPLTGDQLRTSQLRLRTLGEEPVQFVILGPRPSAPSLVRAIVNLTPLSGGRTGQVTVTVTNGEPESFGRAQVTVNLPGGIDPFEPDLSEAVAQCRLSGFVAERGRVTLVFSDLAAGQSYSVAFRVRAARIPSVVESQWPADVAPAGAVR